MIGKCQSVMLARPQNPPKSGHFKMICMDVQLGFLDFHELKRWTEEVSVNRMVKGVCRVGCFDGYNCNIKGTMLARGLILSSIFHVVVVVPEFTPLPHTQYPPYRSSSTVLCYFGISFSTCRPQSTLVRLASLISYARS